MLVLCYDCNQQSLKLTLDMEGLLVQTLNHGLGTLIAMPASGALAVIAVFPSFCEHVLYTGGLFTEPVSLPMKEGTAMWFLPTLSLR